MTTPPPINLCQELFKVAPGWTDTENMYWKKLIEDYDQARVLRRGSITTADGAMICPLYDTDYLLEKLEEFDDVMVRRTSKAERQSKSWVNGNFLASNSYNASAWADDGGNSKDLHEVCGDTPAAALIRLAIVLIGEGKVEV